MRTWTTCIRAMTPRDWLVVVAVAGVLGFVLSTVVRERFFDDPVLPAVIESYRLAPDVARPGQTVTLVATITRRRDDCQISVARQIADADGLIRTYEVPERPMTPSPLGTSEIQLRAVLPDDIIPGPARARSVATYECDDGTYQVVSPWADLTIVAP